MTKRDIYQEITDQIIDCMERGTLPWHKDWSGNTSALNLPKRANGEFYQGINVLLLWIAAEERGYTSDQWFTFKQAKAVGGNVRKGEKGTRIVFYSTFERENDQGEDVKIPFLKSYTVFNAQQIENLPCDLTPDLFGDDDDTGPDAIAELEAFFVATGAVIINDGTNPCYRSGTDTIHMPRVGHFDTAHAYYGTLAHELIHWTGATKRLDRDMKYHTTTGRAFEELIAELGSCFLTARIGGEYNAENSAAYIASWLKALRDDKKFIFRAASAAQKATNFALDCAAANSGTAIAAE